MKDVKINIIKAGSAKGQLFICNHEGTNGNSFNPDQKVSEVIEWLDKQQDVPVFNPKVANLHSQARVEGTESAVNSIAGHESKPNPYDKRWQYTKWNDWCAGHYYAMK